MRRALQWILGGICLLILLGGYLVWNNNRPVAAADRGELESALERSIQWLMNHRQTILDDRNPMLWYMIQQAAELSGDDRLHKLFAAYGQRYLESKNNNVWRPLFHPKTWVPVRFEDIAGYPDYNQHYLYAITCDRDLAQVPEIAAQNAPEFCDQYPLRPACVTHQMMGVLLLKRTECGDTGQLNTTIQALQQRIHRQLTWDPRVVDVYMQRVLMLVASGSGTTVKPVWLRQLLDAQQTDGGWNGFMPLLPVGNDRYIGFRRLPAIGPPSSNFHMTAQGVLLFTLLTHPQTDRQKPAVETP